KPNNAKETKSLAKKIFNIACYVIFAVVLVCLLSVGITLLRGEQPSLFGYQMYYVLTDSMTGTIDKDEVVICKKYDGGQLQVGDIITFEAPEGFEPKAIVGHNITHRIVVAPYQDEDGTWVIETKGDANSIADKVPIPVDNVRATYVGTSDFLAGLMRFLSKWYGFVTLIILPLVGILIFEVCKVIKIKAAEQKKITDDNFDKQRNEEVEKAVQEIRDGLTARDDLTNPDGSPMTDEQKAAYIDEMVERFREAMSKPND
ncbi:MAG: signal peptidase I, partial [Christensenellales bacterium]